MDRPEDVALSTVVRCSSWRQAVCVIGSWRAEGRNTCGPDEMDKIRLLHLMGIRVRLWQRIARPLHQQAGARVKARDLVELVIEPAGGRRG